MEKANVLIVDDDFNNRRLLEVILTQDNYQTHSAASGQQALDIASREPIDLVLLDIMMPGMVGYEVCERLKAGEETRDIPVIFISAKDDRKSILHGFEIGAYDYFTKPINQAEIQVKITNCLRLSRAEREFKRERDRRLNTESIIQFISGETSGVTGVEFFNSLLMHASRTLNIGLAFVAEFVPYGDGLVQTMAVCEDQQLLENFTYNYQNTPTEDLIREKIMVVAEGIRNRYPEDEDLERVDAEGYAAVLLVGENELPLGILVMVSKIPFNEPDYIQSVLGAISVRASAELQRMHHEAHQALTKARLDMAITATEAGIYDYRIPFVQNIYFSPRYMAIMETESEKMPTAGDFENWFLSRIHPDEQEGIRLKYKDFLEGSREKFDARMRILTEKGNWVHVQNHAIAPEHDAKGRVSRVVGVLVDRTAEFQKERAILHESNVNKALSELSANLIDPDKRIKDISKITLEFALALTRATGGLIGIINDDVLEVNFMIQSDIAGHPGNHPASAHSNTQLGNLNIRKGKDGRFRGLLGHAMNTRLPFFTNDAQSHPSYTPIMPEDHVVFQRFLAVPAKLGDRLVGQISLSNDDRPFTDEDLKVVAQLTELFAVAVYRREMEEAVKEGERRIVNAIIETEEKERSRFAQDLHDGLGPLLSTIKLYIRSLETLEDEEKRSYAYQKSLEIIDQSIASLKETANNISPHVLKNFGLISALRQFIKQVSGTNKVSISLESNLEDRMEEQFEVTMFRIVVELIHNTLKHAGASRIEIYIGRKRNSLELQYTDDGVGMDVESVMQSSGGLGIRGIYSRVETLGGRVFLNQDNKVGFTARVVFDRKQK